MAAHCRPSCRAPAANALQVLGKILICLVVIVCTGDQSLIHLAPIVFVFAIVVVARFRNADLEKVRIAKHRVGSCVAAARMAIDAGAVDVDPRISRGELLHAADLIRQRVITHVAVVKVVKTLDRSGFPIPSISTTMKPSSASA